MSFFAAFGQCIRHDRAHGGNIGDDELARKKGCVLGRHFSIGNGRQIVDLRHNTFGAPFVGISVYAVLLKKGKEIGAVCVRVVAHAAQQLVDRTVQPLLSVRLRAEGCPAAG